MHEEKNLNWSTFAQVDMRVGTIIEAQPFPEARNPSFKLLIDFGPLGQLKSSAQITELYEAQSLIGQQVIAVVNFPAKQIANMMSECLVLGAVGNDKKVTLLCPERPTENGTKIG